MGLEEIKPSPHVQLFKNKPAGDSMSWNEDYNFWKSISKKFQFQVLRNWTRVQAKLSYLCSREEKNHLNKNHNNKCTEFYFFQDVSCQYPELRQVIYLKMSNPG